MCDWGSNTYKCSKFSHFEREGREEERSRGKGKGKHERIAKKKKKEELAKKRGQKNYRRNYALNENQQRERWHHNLNYLSHPHQNL